MKWLLGVTALAVVLILLNNKNAELSAYKWTNKQ